jgi:hypothetical protein
MFVSISSSPSGRRSERAWETYRRGLPGTFRTQWFLIVGRGDGYGLVRNGTTLHAECVIASICKIEKTPRFESVEEVPLEIFSPLRPIKNFSSVLSSISNHSQARWTFPPWNISQLEVWSSECFRERKMALVSFMNAAAKSACLLLSTRRLLCNKTYTQFIFLDGVWLNKV